MKKTITRELKKMSAIISIVLMVSCDSEPKQNKTIVKVENGEMTSITGTRKISGIYPHLTTYAHARADGTYGSGEECGIGAMAIWNNKLYVVNYAAHRPQGSEHKLYIIDKDKNMEVFEGSIGGTPACRMVHKESNQLLIGPYVIDGTGNIRVIPIKNMEGRLTAIARHLKDPENLVYYYDMEGMLYEVNVYSLAVKKLFQDPLPGWHGKGAYTSQGKLVLANNGEHANEGRVTTDTDDWDSEHYQWVDTWKIGKEGVFGPENLGALAEFDGDNFKLIERKQFTDVTTKNGINAVPNDTSPLWAMGWDKKAVQLKVLDKGKWHTYLLPKATYNNDPPHGWFTEWPRIREVGNDRMLMDMHGMFYDFPNTFSASNTSGIKPIGSHLRYIPDFLFWNNQIVLATDETSIQGNPLAGQPQSNLWFGSYEELSNWGPSSAYGAIWLNEEVKADDSSKPFLIADFDNRMVHLKNHGKNAITITFEIDSKGNNNWETYKTIQIKPGAYRYYIFDKDLKAEWIRLSSNTASKLTAAFHFTDDDSKHSSEERDLFSGLADITYEGEVNHAMLYSNKTDFNLSVYSREIANKSFKTTKGQEFTKFDFEFVEGIKDSTSKRALNLKSIWFEDKASVVLETKMGRLRLPKGHSNYTSKFPSSAVRSVREVESERELANIAGTFYELPLFKVGEEPLYDMMRPISTHNKQISDYNTWNGLLVLSGVKRHTPASEHIYSSEDGNTSLWFGGIDDIWNFGKPVGEGGPWKDTQIKGNELSDRYLMTGYHKKSLRLETDKDVQFTLLIHVNHYLREPMIWKTFDVKANEPVSYEFPEGFSAHWIQLKADKDCKATAWLVYR
ncbi:hypothetical protein UMM65_13800 [Aureibaculum sp. 2210JD6-5]|uniref:hypothetical protein n=1 Tax=Aureibaculum sp. 2210JD6-5 TaxID=3103957 RepID=UPI002AAEBF27|nr:hypothetical protein [Aureibaculum sp. 2210JD6-5]MDY7396320.1 hypothetical protein [Aureibaculum sp. 2210JD6-5]